VATTRSASAQILFVVLRKLWRVTLVELHEVAAKTMVASPKAAARAEAISTLFGFTRVVLGADLASTGSSAELPDIE
jgi:hypothetical protein